MLVKVDSLEENLKVIKDAKLDIEILRRQNEKLCEENNVKIEGFEGFIAEAETLLEVGLKESGEKKLECKLGYSSYRAMPDKWFYDDEEVINWCKDFKKPYYYTQEIVRRAELKKAVLSGVINRHDVCGIEITPQDPKFTYKLKWDLL